MDARLMQSHTNLYCDDLRGREYDAQNNEGHGVQRRPVKQVKSLIRFKNGPFLYFRLFF